MIRASFPNMNVFEELGEGGFKVVYRAAISGTHEALKLIQIPTDPQDASVALSNRRRANREIDILRACRSPYLVKLGSLSPASISINGYEYLSYSEELIIGQALRDRIRHGYRPGISVLASLACCLLDVVSELEQLTEPVVHRDIKPENIIALEDGQRPYVLLDMGIAFVVGATNFTLNPAAIPGTRYYKAPEMFNANFRDNLDSRADLYTIGLTLYEFASGINPFHRTLDNEYDTVVRILQDTPRPLVQVCPALDREFCSVVDTMLSKMPAMRPGNIAMLKRKMEAWQ